MHVTYIKEFGTIKLYPFLIKNNTYTADILEHAYCICIFKNLHVYIPQKTVVPEELTQVINTLRVVDHILQMLSNFSNTSPSDVLISLGWNI